ncbi:CpsL protein [Streptococcus thermophilus TH1436]|nr:CpsL protein [Streptococcus thermophilus TH1436]ETE41980.1 CpsL protein [Streptococcus thermophilus TH1435]
MLSFTQKLNKSRIILSLEGVFLGSLSTVVGDEKLTSREDRIGPFFMYVQCDEDTLLKVDKVSKTEAQTFDVFDQLISRFKFRV